MLALRYLFGIAGNPLTNSAIGDNATRVLPADIVQYIENIKPVFDIDGDGRVDALTDGVLMLRYLFGLRNNSLMSGAVSTGATRTPTQIQAYLLSIMQ